MRRRSRAWPPQEVFLSHAARNRRFATRLATTLRAAGVPVWYSRTHLVGAQQWHDEIGRALARCDWFLLLLSPAAVDSEWVKRELLYALNDKRYKSRILPIVYQNCDMNRLSWTLGSYQHIDFTGRFDVGYRELMRAWGVKFDAV